MIYPDTVIISNPRSGLNWVRYCIEWFSRCKTPGRRRPVPIKLLSSKKFITCRTHDAFSLNDILKGTNIGIFDKDSKPKFKKAILLIRNYKELVARNIYTISEEKIKKRLTLAALENNDDFPLSCIGANILYRYTRNILAYDCFPKEKIHIYYEDLIPDFSQILKILDFMEINYDLSDFNLEEHRLKSIKSYNFLTKALRGSSNTANDQLNFTFYSDKYLNNKQKIILDNIVQKNLPIVYKKYLNRYKEEYL